jgi:hypothetical protein
MSDFNINSPLKVMIFKPLLTQSDPLKPLFNQNYLVLKAIIIDSILTKHGSASRCTPTTSIEREEDINPDHYHWNTLKVEQRLKQEEQAKKDAENPELNQAKKDA